MTTDAQTKIPQGIYRHFKGGLYDVWGIATHSETGELLVIYRPQYGDRRLTVRPLGMFQESIVIKDAEGEEPALTVLRFELVSSNQDGPKP